MEGGLAAEGDGVEAVAEGGEAQRILMRLQRGCEVAAHGLALCLVEPNRKRTSGPCGTGVGYRAWRRRWEWQGVWLVAAPAAHFVGRDDNDDDFAHDDTADDATVVNVYERLATPRNAVGNRREGILLTNSRLAVELTEHALRQSFPSRAVCPCWLLFDVCFHNCEV